MKKLFSTLALILTLALLPSAALAKDKKKDKDYEAWKKVSKAARDDVKDVEKYYNQVRDRVKNLGGDRRQWGQLQQINGEIERLDWQINNANVDPRYVRDRCQQLRNDLRGVQLDLENSNSRRGGFYRYR